MDEFSDDGFDELNAALLQELENKALQSLQPASIETIQIDDDDVNHADAEVLRELARVPSRVPAQSAFFSCMSAAAMVPPPLPAYSQRSIADVPLPAAAPTNGLHERGLQRTQPRTTAATAAPATTATTAITAAKMPPADNALVTALQARVRMLETDLYTARGKASMIQSKYETVVREHEAEVARIQALKEAELAAQRERAEAAMAAQRSAATELEFAKQDLKEEVEKSKKGRRGGDRSADGNPTTPRKGTTGRSNWNVADGFDDIELLPSPSKGLGRCLKDAGGGASSIPAIERTPTKGKRRRPTTDSPTAMQLETQAVDADVFGPSPQKSADHGTAAAAGVSREAAQPEDAQGAFMFLQDVLGHQSHPDGPSTIELFSRYSFPSNRKQTLAFLVLQRIPMLEGGQGTTRLMLDFCLLVLGIWSQCLREMYYSPVQALVSVLSYILSRDPCGLAPHILQPLLRLAQESIYLVAAPAFNSPSGDLSNHPDYAVRQLACDIDAGAIMSLMRLAAASSLRSSASAAADAASTQPRPSQASASTSTAFPELSVSAQTWFWSQMQFEFVLLMLSSKQPPDAFLGMMALLRTSALPDSIGPITNDPAKDASVVASLIIDRISHHIEEPPKWAYPCRYSEWDVRLSALGVLDCFAQTSFGKLSLAASECTLPRLVSVLFPAYGELRDRDLLQSPLHPTPGWLPLSDAEIRAYGIGGLDLSLTLGPSPDKLDGPAAAVGSISGTDRSTIPLVLLHVSATIYLLHSIITDPLTSAVANMPARLAKTRGGTQSFYLLTMARLGFRADPVFATGLLDETYKLALELFKLAATPDEDADYSQWAQQSRSTRDVAPTVDPFSDGALWAQERPDAEPMAT